MKKTVLCATILTLVIVTAFSLHWSKLAAVMALIASLTTLGVILPEIRSTVHEIKRNKN